MAEYIDKVKLMSRIESELMRWGESEYNALQILGDIDDFLSADVVEVVRCKDCAYRYTKYCNAKHERADMDFCSSGIRK